MRKRLKRIPKFKSEQAEAALWSKHDSTDFLDYSKARRLRFPRLKPSTETISLRLPKAQLEDLRILANKRDVPYQTLLKFLLADRMEQEFSRTRIRRPLSFIGIGRSKRKHIADRAEELLWSASPRKQKT